LKNRNILVIPDVPPFNIQALVWFYGNGYCRAPDLRVLATDLVDQAW